MLLKFFDIFSFGSRCSWVHDGVCVTNFTAPEKPAMEMVDTVIDNAIYKAVFVKQLKGSDFSLGTGSNIDLR